VGNTICSYASIYPSPSDIRIENSIIWDNPDSIRLGDESTLLVAFCDIPGAGPGYGNIDSDPCFVNPGYWDPNGTPEDANDDFFVPGDYHLKSQSGRWDANAGGWTIDEVTSPCIDAGDPNNPLGEEPFPNGGRINIGAYGGTAEASKSYFGKPPCETIVAGDINGDCFVNSLDFALMASHWLGRYPETYAGFATNVYPEDGELYASNYPCLRWTAGSNTISHDIYLAPDYAAIHDAHRGCPEYKGNQSNTTYCVSRLLNLTTYYWRIDEISPTGETTRGPIWSFTTGTAPPGQATDPNPPNDANDLTQPIVLSWSPGGDALSHDVYFGDDPLGSLSFMGNQTSTTFAPGPLIPGARYYWRIDEVGIVILRGQMVTVRTTGPVWTFTTGADSTR